jgi:hypothetical protein
VRVSLFVDPEPAAIRWAKTMGADRVELYTEPFARAFERGPDAAAKSFDEYSAAANLAYELGVGVNAGHDLDLKNLTLFKKLPHLDEVSIGHALIARAIFVGLGKVVKEYLAALATILLAVILGTAHAEAAGRPVTFASSDGRDDRRRVLRGRLTFSRGRAGAHAVEEPRRMAGPAGSDSRRGRDRADHRSARSWAVIGLPAGSPGDGAGRARGGAVARDAAQRSRRHDWHCRRFVRRQPGVNGVRWICRQYGRLPCCRRRWTTAGCEPTWD